MSKNNDLPYRKSPRLKDYDYSTEGAYFITICTRRRSHLFGEISNDEMTLNPLGKLAQHYWAAVPDHYPTAEIGEFVVMPNHMHAILFLIDNPTTPRVFLATIIGAYKGSVTRQAHRLLDIEGSIWQRSFHDHIIRDEKSFVMIQEYVQQNPLRWEKDTFYS